MVDRPHLECNKNQSPLATGNQPDQTETHIASVKCAEATDERLGRWMTGRGESNKWTQEGLFEVPSYLPFVFKIARQKLGKTKQTK